MFKNRYLETPIKNDLKDKMVFLGGPRQVGKTTLASEKIGIHFKSHYLTWDKISQRNQALRGEWPPDVELIILDEFHKQKNWKTWIKGEYDVHKSRLNFLLTGSARLNIYRKGGDSLQGRYHFHTLHPFSLKELMGDTIPDTEINEPLFINPDREGFSALLQFGGFPEPLFKQDKRFLNRWHNEKNERFFREDIRDLTAINHLGTLSLMADMLPERVSSILSINSVAEDLQVNFRTASNWLDTFDELYYCFRIHSHN